MWKAYDEPCPSSQLALFADLLKYVKSFRIIMNECPASCATVILVGIERDRPISSHQIEPEPDLSIADDGAERDHRHDQNINSSNDNAP